MNKRDIGIEALLNESMDAQFDELAPRFDGFVREVLSHLDDDVPAEPERVLRVDDVTPEEIADAALIDDPSFELAGAVLRAEAEAEVGAQDWAAFAAGIEDAIDGEALAPAVGLALREATETELETRDWPAFTAAIEDGIDGELAAETVGAALREATEAEVEAQDWAAFSAGIEDAIDGEALAPAMAAALTSEVEEAVAAREGDWADFTSGVMAKLPAETVTVAELLTENTEAELAARDGEWNAFTARVFEAVDAEARAVATAPLEAQAVAQLKADVESEVESMAGAFGETFKKDVDKQIFKAGQQADPWWTRAWAWVKDLFDFEGGYGLAAAAATAVLLVAVTGLPPTGTNPGVEPIISALPGEVAVEALSFEGDVTVMPEDGITIVWLDAPS